MSLIRRIITGLLALLGILYAIFFSVNNMEEVPISLPLLGDYRPTSFVAYLGAFFAGVIVAGTYCSLELIRKSMQLRKLRKDINGSRRQPHKRARRFLVDDTPMTKPEPSIHSADSKDY